MRGARENFANLSKTCPSCSGAASELDRTDAQALQASTYIARARCDAMRIHSIRIGPNIDIPATY